MAGEKKEWKIKDTRSIQDLVHASLLFNLVWRLAILDFDRNLLYRTCHRSCHAPVTHLRHPVPIAPKPLRSHLFPASTLFVLAIHFCLDALNISLCSGTRMVSPTRVLHELLQPYAPSLLL
jgi:hypothetical protein